MNKKKVIKTVVIIVIALVAFVAISIIGYHFIKQRVELSETNAICQEIELFMKNDEEFISQYGAVKSVTLHKDYKREIVNSNELKVPCLVEANDGMYLVWVDFYFTPTDTIITYISVTEETKG